jgi:hypothetical protein
VLRRATAHISPGPGHATRVAAAVGKESALLNQVFEALRFSLRVAIQHGFLVVLLFCGGAVTAALLLRDRQGSEESSVRRH